MNEITERIARLRRLMETYHMDAYLVPTADFHESEYVGEHFACRKYITGFTGSAGIAWSSDRGAVPDRSYAGARRAGL